MMINLKKIKTLCLFFIAAFAISLFTSGCYGWMTQRQFEKMLALEEADESDLTAKELVKEMAKATDPLGAYKNADSYILRQSIVEVQNIGAKNSTEEYMLEVKYKAPDRMRQTSFHDGRPSSVIIFNGDNAWNFFPSSNRYEKIPPGKQLDLVKAFSSMVNPGTDYTEIFDDVEIGIVYQDRQKYYRIICRVENPNIAPYVIYVDAKTFLTNKLETILYANDGSTYLYRAVSENYTWMSNVRMATMSVVEAGNKRSISTIQEFHLNPDLPDSDFLPQIPFTHSVEE